MMPTKWYYEKKSIEIVNLLLLYLMFQYGRKTSLTLCISPSCHHAVGAIHHDNVRKTHDVDVFVQNERVVQFKQSDVIINKVRVITLVHQHLGDSPDLLMGVVLGLVVFARLYGQMVQVAIAEKRQSFIDFEIFKTDFK